MIRSINKPLTLPRLQSTLLVSALLFITACTHNDFEHLGEHEADRPLICFQTETGDPPSGTRAAGTTLEGAHPLLSMGVYAAYTDENWNVDAPLNYLMNQEVKRTDVKSTWEYAPEQFWPGSGRISFFAYAPYGNGQNGITVTASTGKPVIDFTVSTDPAQQVDLLVARPVLNQAKSSGTAAVTLALSHALTKIGFSARLNQSSAADTEVKITKIALTRLYAKGKYPMDGSQKQWTNLTDDTQAFAVHLCEEGNNSHVADKGDHSLLNQPLTDVYAPLSADNGYLFLLPQPICDEARITISYDIITATRTESKTFDLNLASAISQFKCGEAYNFLFTIDTSVSFVVAPVVWNEMKIHADIQNRILNVTRLEAQVTDAAVTRIYFWSNQPKDAVAVESTGHSDTAFTGIAFRVNDIYQTLSGLSDATTQHPATSHIVYRGINEEFAFNGLEKGEGYLDVVHKEGIPPIASVGNHIYLNASGLVRSIRLNSFNSPIDDTDSTPYTGTFHRCNEMGERLIRWALPAGQTWTAEVMNVASQDENGRANNDYTEVLIDRLQSPAMEQKSLYTTTPLSSEKCWVVGQAGDWSKQKVSGVGTVYFRVGWRSTAPSHRNRYAQIKVTVNSTTEYLLYLRQGEADDYVMRPTDKWNGNTRPHAIKWSPYNLKDSKEGINNQLPKSGRTPAVNYFTQYPTQAGYLFQWASSNEPRRAYSPHVASVANWGTVPTTGFWDTLLADNETCPQGYRRPISGGINKEVDPLNHLNSEIKQSFIAHPEASSYQPNEHSVWGYYADGFFDRLKISSQQNVATDTPHIAYLGSLLVNPTSLSSLFLPASGYRTRESIHTNMDEAPYLEVASGCYLSASRSVANAIYLQTKESTIGVAEAKKEFAMAVRCVRDVSFGSDLVDWEDVYAPVGK